jgi:hypothetical protein
MRTALTRLLAPLPLLLLNGCFTDAATRLAYDIEAATARVAPEDGARFTLVHHVPSRSGECTGPYKIQFDAVGLIVIWCKNADGDKTVSSHSTSYHRRFVETPETHLLDKPAGESVTIFLERRDGRVIIASVK